VISTCCLFQHANAGTAQRLPGGQILTIQQGAQSQSIVRQALPSPIHTVRPQAGGRVPHNVQSMRTTPSGSSSAQPAAAAQGQYNHSLEIITPSKHNQSELLNNESEDIWLKVIWKIKYILKFYMYSIELKLLT